MGSAFIAVADDASAPYWNPAGIIRAQGKAFLASHQPLSLDRLQNSVSFTLNLRRELGFGFTWLHAGVGNIVARTADGRQIPGEIDDSENALYVSASRALGRRLALGLTMKVFDQRLKVPLSATSIATSTGKGNGFDLGFQLLITEKTMLAGVVRNLNAKLNWKVERNSQETSTSEDDLPLTLVLGASHRPTHRLLLAADLHSSNVDLHLNLGAEWSVNPTLTLQGGLNRVPGDDRGIGSTTAGLILRPMRRDTLQFHFAYATDELDAGGRTMVGLSLKL